jgi:hypothetical protein
MGHICHLLMILSQNPTRRISLFQVRMMTLSKTARTQTFIDLFMLVLCILNFYKIKKLCNKFQLNCPV